MLGWSAALIILVLLTFSNNLKVTPVRRVSVARKPGETGMFTPVLNVVD
jgi:hypothetical protein